MLQATVGDCLALDPFAFEEDGVGSSEVDVGRREITQALVVASVIVMIDELFNVGFKIARQVVVFQQDAVLERLMPAFDLALCLRMVGRAANVPDILRIQPLSQIRRDVTGTVIAEQAWLMWTTRA